ncbi:MAG TPA: hypothetical protein VEB42_11935, partial [Chitinophagaceae bacterium]|nr:hypothetical protein [Chitinophagaceae bacterium]
PVFLIPSFLNLAQREENQYRSVATVKIIQRYGILDSVIHIDKGSKVSTKDLLYDSETGNVLLTRTQNEFNDQVYNFTYPSHWAYDGMGHAYQNMDVTLKDIDIRNGKIVRGLNAADSVFFSSGDELLVAGKVQTGGATGCAVPFSTFPSYTKIWAIDSSVLNGGPKSFYFIDREGNPYNGFQIDLKIIRSGRRNIDGALGTVTTLANPLVKDPVTHQYGLVLNTASKVVNASAGEYSQFWKVDEIQKKKTSINCAYFQPQDCAGDTSCTCKCLKKLFDYLISSNRLFITKAQNITVSSLVADANTAGYALNVSDCQLLQQNSNRLFYALTFDTVGTQYSANIGNCVVSWTAA